MSSGRSVGPTLGPAELDRLEDALEDLDLDRALEELDGDDPVAQRLSEYREVLALCRDAMPLEDVPPGLLDGVLAEARTAAAATAPAAAAAAPSFWSRWRLGVWVPTLAFAGSAALLLVVLVPKRGEEGVAAESAVARREQTNADAKAGSAPAADERLALAEPEPGRAADPARLESEDAIRGAGVAIGEREPAPAPAAPVVPAPAADEQAEVAVDDAKADKRRTTAEGGVTTGSATGDYDAKPKPTSKAPGGASKGKSAPPSDPFAGGGSAGGGASLPSGAKDDAPTEKEQKADEGGGPWAELASADADRRSGSCGLAKMRYDKLRKRDEAAIRARALAGAGLCAAASGDEATAKKLFAQARAADPGVSGFIDRELALLDDARANANDPSPQSKE